jgi:phage tail tape-measure protein
MSDKKPGQPDANPDPITGAPGAHPVGVGLGATSGGTIGAVVGVVAGPVGVAVGATVGAVAGGLAGKGLAELADPTVEGANWESVEPRLREDWNRAGGGERLDWEKASPAVRDAWNRLRADAGYRKENI